MLAKVYLEITNVCNLDCAFCVGTRRQKKLMTVEEFRCLAEKLVGHTKFLYFHLMGEPLLHPELGTFLDIAGGLGFRVILTTNGTLLGKCTDVLLGAPALHKVNISLHSFEANDGKVDLDAYLHDCFSFGERASQNGIITVFRLWNEGGQNALNRSVLDKMHSFFDGEWVTNSRGMRIKDKLFTENGEYFEWPLTSHVGAEKVFCYGLKDQVGVLCDGTVVPCCLDYDGNLALGNLFVSTLEEILEKNETKAFRSSLDKCCPPSDMCKTCGFAIQKFKV